jgi:hypothetical protein
MPLLPEACSIRPSEWRRIAWHVSGQPGPELGAEAGFGRIIAEVHQEFAGES